MENESSRARDVPHSQNPNGMGQGGLTEVCLKSLPLSDAEKEARMEGSHFSATSTNNTDICILDAHESHYGYDNKSRDEAGSYDTNAPYLEHFATTCHIDAPDFTVLHTPTSHSIPALRDHRHSTSCAFDESTEVLLMHSTECNRKGSGHAFSGTDSDVEVLMSEEIIDSDWSAGGAGVLEESPQGSPDERTDLEALQVISPIKETAFSQSESVKPQESTDQEISVEEFSGSSMSACHSLSRRQLLKVINEQGVRIRKLEAIIQRYRKLFEHVETVRTEIEADAVAVTETEFNRSHETIH